MNVVGTQSAIHGIDDYFAGVETAELASDGGVDYSVVFARGEIGGPADDADCFLVGDWFWHCFLWRILLEERIRLRESGKVTCGELLVLSCRICCNEIWVNAGL